MNTDFSAQTIIPDTEVRRQINDTKDFGDVDFGETDFGDGGLGRRGFKRPRFVPRPAAIVRKAVPAPIRKVAAPIKMVAAPIKMVAKVSPMPMQIPKSPMDIVKAPMQMVKAPIAIAKLGVAVAQTGMAMIKKPKRNEEGEVISEEQAVAEQAAEEIFSSSEPSDISEGKTIAPSGQITTMAQVAKAPVAPKKVASSYRHPLLAYTDKSEGMSGLFDKLKAKVSSYVAPAKTKAMEALSSGLKQTAAGAAGAAASTVAERPEVKAAAAKALEQQATQKLASTIQEHKSSIGLGVLAAAALGAALLLKGKK